MPTWFCYVFYTYNIEYAHLKEFPDTVFVHLTKIDLCTTTLSIYYGEQYYTSMYTWHSS